MFEKKKKEPDPMGVNMNIGQAYELSDVSENKQLSTLETERIEETPFIMVKQDGIVRLTINGAVATEAIWKNYQECKQWVMENSTICQVATTMTLEILKRKEELQKQKNNEKCNGKG